MRIAIIGAGNMGGATALGLARFCPEARITVTARHQETLDRYSGVGIASTLDNSKAVEDADLVISPGFSKMSFPPSCP